MPPSQQRFHPGDFHRLQIDLGLVIDVELFALHCQMQTALDRQTLLHRAAQLLRGHVVRVPRLGLGAIHGTVGVLEQRLGIVSIFGKRGDADARLT
jgi:hypothetical protein